MSFTLGVLNCPTNTTNTSSAKCQQEVYPFGIGLVSDTGGMIGSIIVIILYYTLTELRTRARQILLFISIADFFNALLYFIAQFYSIIELKYTVCYPGKSYSEKWTCIFQAAFTNFFSLASFSFTSFLALHIVFLFYNKQIFERQFIFILTIILAFAFPFIITIISFSLNFFGPNNDPITTGWCFIMDANSLIDTKIVELMVGKLWDLVTFVFISICYLMVLIHLFCIQRKKTEGKNFAMKDIKPIIIPLAFLLLRLPGLIRYFSFITSTELQCSVYLEILQVILEPAQGWTNAIIFVVLTKSVRVGLTKVWYRVIKKKHYITTLNYDNSDSNVKSNSHSNFIEEKLIENSFNALYHKFEDTN